jgi:hypothetical protein
MEHQGIESELAGRTRLIWYWYLRSERLMDGLMAMGRGERACRTQSNY